jgi:hypothetical protein
MGRVGNPVSPDVGKERKSRQRRRTDEEKLDLPEYLDPMCDRPAGRVHDPCPYRNSGGQGVGLTYIGTTIADSGGQGVTYATAYLHAQVARCQEVGPGDHHQHPGCGLVAGDPA